MIHLDFPGNDFAGLAANRSFELPIVKDGRMMHEKSIPSTICRDSSMRSANVECGVSSSSRVLVL